MSALGQKRHERHVLPKGIPSFVREKRDCYRVPTRLLARLSRWSGLGGLSSRLRNWISSRSHRRTNNRLCARLLLLVPRHRREAVKPQCIPERLDRFASASRRVSYTFDRTVLQERVTHDVENFRVLLATQHQQKHLGPQQRPFR